MIHVCVKITLCKLNKDECNGVALYELNIDDNKGRGGSEEFILSHSYVFCFQVEGSELLAFNIPYRLSICCILSY